jgi:type VI secretion system FHA domain protein
MKLLQARQELKREFRLDQTMFRPADNNPLKFSTSVEDALHNLLVKRVAGYLPPVDAFEDAFEDIRNHQVAMLAGLRVAFDAMLEHFDPAHLQEEFDRQSKKAALVSMPAKLRYWDQYSAKFHDMVRDSEACYSKLFGDEFARAYEEQLSRLKGQTRPPKR